MMRVGWMLGVVLLAGCLEPPQAEQGSAGGVSVDRELTNLRAEVSAVRAENALLRAQLLGDQPWSETIQLASVGGTGGETFARVCPNGEGLVGVRGRAGALIDSLGPVCAPLDPPDAPLGTEVGPFRTELPPAGGSGGAPYETFCPDGQVAVGVRGHAGNIVSGMRLVCRPLDPEAFQVMHGDTAEGTAEGTADEGTGEARQRSRARRRQRGEESPAVGGQEGSAFTRNCPAGWVIVGMTGHGGIMVDQLSVHCGPWVPPNP